MADQPAEQAPTPPDDTTLIRRARGGDLNAFNALVLRYQDHLYTVSYRILGDAESAADATQDALITAYRKIATYRGGSFKAWLARITTNTCYDELRRRQRRPATPLDELPGSDHDDGPPLPSESPSPEQIAQQHELSAAIQRCIDALKEEQRVVLVLSDVEGLAYQEIAAAIGGQLGTVKSRLSRARAALRHCLQGLAELLPPEYRLSPED